MYCAPRSRTLEAVSSSNANSPSQNLLPPLTATLADLVSDGILLLDPSNLTILDLNRSFARKMGQSRESLLGRKISTLLRSVDVAKLSEPCLASIESEVEHAFVAELVQQDGETQPVAVSMCCKELEGQSVLVLAVRPAHDGDLEDHKLREFIAAAQADPLTGLPNRCGLDVQLERITSPDAIAGRMLAVMFIDVDHFKSINDRLGHSAGDVVLREVAQRLRDSVRPGDFVGRFGGDEFVVVANDIDGQNDATELARRICHKLRQPIQLCDCTEHEVQVTVSVGVAVEHPRRKRDELVALADREMYRAKAAGRDRFSMQAELNRI